MRSLKKNKIRRGGLDIIEMKWCRMSYKKGNASAVEMAFAVSLSYTFMYNSSSFWAL